MLVKSFNLIQLANEKGPARSISVDSMKKL